MRGIATFGLGLSLVVSVGCTRENPAFLGDVATTTDTTAGTSLATGTMGSSGGTGTSTTGGVCEFPSLGRLNADVLMGGQSVVDCGQAFESWGFLTDFGPGPMRQFQMCADKDCLNCQGEFDFLLTGPAGTVPTTAPQCVRVTVEKEIFNPTTQLCEFSGVVLSREEDGVVVVPMFAGSSGVVSPPDGLSIPGSNLEVSTKPRETCSCVDCCGGEAFGYNLSFNLATESTELGPTESFTTTITDRMFQITNLRSHEQGECEAPLSVDWTVLDVEFK